MVFWCFFYCPRHSSCYFFDCPVLPCLPATRFKEWPTDSLSRSRYGPRSSSCNGGATNKKGARSSLFFSGTKSASTSSLNIESALEAFSFLDSEISSPQSEEVPPPRWVDMMSSSTPQCSLRLVSASPAKKTVFLFLLCSIILSSLFCGCHLHIYL